MENWRALHTPQERIAWALERAKARGITPERVAERVGLSRPAVLNWRKPETNIDAVGIGGLVRFAPATGINLDWLLRGRGEPDKTYTPSEEVTSLMDQLDRLEREEPTEFRLIARIIRSAVERPSK